MIKIIIKKFGGEDLKINRFDANRNDFFRGFSGIRLLPIVVLKAFIRRGNGINIKLKKWERINKTDKRLK